MEKINKTILFADVSNLSISDSRVIKNFAATNWIGNFIDSCVQLGMKITVCSRVIMSPFPIGYLYRNNRKYFSSKYPITVISYINLLFFRNITIILSSIFIVANQYCNNNKINNVIFFNPYLNNNITALFAKYILRLKTTCIVADSNFPGFRWERFPWHSKLYDRYVFLSQWAYDTFPLNNKFRYYGGFKIDNSVKESLIKPRDSIIKLLYTGMLDKWGGVDMLLKAYSELDRSKYELTIVGYGAKSEYFKDAVLSLGVKFYSDLTNDEVISLIHNSDILVNPRDPNNLDNYMNFPSKLISYIESYKTVISFRTPGIGSFLDGVVSFTDKPTVDSLVNQINCQSQIRHVDSSRKAYLYSFLKENCWVLNTKYLIEWLDT